ncbi:hypothetical protein [Amycolatopsis sp. NPDC004079]|uniref:hypothetical protein n=1 Tax=Amycolatopsis sp. NPDC004079 TaxID=3154549 RepID=UPI0033AFF409
MDAGEIAERDELRRALQELRERREADEREAGQLPRLEAEIAATRRDRDAEMSPEMDRARREVDRACVDAEELVFAVSRLWTRVQIAELDESDPRLRAASRAVEDDFRAAIKAFAAAVNSEEPGGGAP